MEKTEQLLREIKEREIKDNTYIKIVATLILIAQIVIGHIICVNITLSEKKTDYRYFNLVTSLEKINGVYIDTYDGIAYSSAEELVFAKEKRTKEEKSKKSFVKKYMKLLTNS